MINGKAGSGMATEKRVRVLFLDLDGTVRHGKAEMGRFVNSVADVRVFDEVPALLAEYKRLGWRIVAVSNQGGIALGILSVRDCGEAVLETNVQCGNVFDVMSVCRHHPDAKDPEHAICWCRKPRGGLLIESVHALKSVNDDEMYPPHLALMVGDRPEDRGAAEAAAVPFLDAAEWRTGAHLASVRGD